MRYIKYFISLLLLLTLGYSQFDQTETKTRSLIPRLDSTYDLGKVGREYDSLFVDHATFLTIDLDSISASYGLFSSDLDSIIFDPNVSLYHLYIGTAGVKMFTIDTTGIGYFKGNLSSDARVSGAFYGSDGSVTDAELLYINTLSSNVQTQITDNAALVDTDDEIIAIINASPSTQIGVPAGGIGVGTLNDGGLLVGAGTGAVEVLADGLTTQVLVGGGANVNPAWGADLPTAVTIGAKYIYRVDGTDVADADVVDDIKVTSTKKISTILTSEQMRLGYDATNYAKHEIADDGKYTITTEDPDGTEADIVFMPDGNFGIGTDNPSAKLDILGGNFHFLGANVDTDATQKLCRISWRHYTNAEEPVGLMYGSSEVGHNYLGVGGGSALINAVTNLKLYTAVNATTTTGTNRLEIDNNGDVGIGITPATGTKLKINGKVHVLDDVNVTGDILLGGITKLKSVVVTLSAAQVNALRASPQTVVAAQGANTWIELVSAFITYDYGSAAFTVGADEDLVIEYADGTDATASIETTGFLDQMDDEIRFYPFVLAAGADPEASLNQALRIFNTGTGETADGTACELDIRVTYRVYNTGF